MVICGFSGEMETTLLWMDPELASSVSGRV
jgi:hypothetical protein